MICLIICHERDQIIILKFLSIPDKEMCGEKHHRAFGPTSICPSPSMDSKKDGIPPAVHPALSPGRTDLTGGNTNAPNL